MTGDLTARAKFFSYLAARDRHLAPAGMTDTLYVKSDKLRDAAAVHDD